MKNALRDVLLIIALFGAILLAPFVMDALSGPEEPEPEKTKTETVQQESRPAPESFGDMPPQPRPFSPDSAPGRLERLEEDMSRGAAPPGRMDTSVPDAGCPDHDLGEEAPPGQAAGLRSDGSGGRDTLKMGGGDIALDGKQFRSMEVIDVRNGEPNKVAILGAGLVALEGRHAYVLADRNIDIVYLDRCLRWNDPIAISDDGPEPLLRYDTYDRHGNVSYLSVSEGVMVQRMQQK